MKWEYKVEILNMSSDCKVDLKERMDLVLGLYSEQGWEIFQVVPTNVELVRAISISIVIFMKRPVEEKLDTG
jgi:hypothetical protein